MSVTYELPTPRIGDLSLKYYLETSTAIVQKRIFPPHVHDTLEIYVLLDGNASFMVEHTLYNLTAGDVVISKPNEMHNCILNSDSVHQHFCLWAAPEASDFFFGALTAHPFGERNVISAPEEEKKRIISLCRELYRAGETGDQMTAFTCALEFFRMLNENIAESGNEAELPPVFASILADVNLRFAEIDKVEDIAARYFISRSTLCRMFRNYLHTSPKYYLETKKLAYSRILLREGKSVYDASAEAGFPDYSNYIRLFRKRFGITPRVYRKN